LQENGSGWFWKKIYRKPEVEILNINFVFSLRILKQKSSMFWQTNGGDKPLNSLRSRIIKLEEYLFVENARSWIRNIGAGSC